MRLQMAHLITVSSLTLGLFSCGDKVKKGTSAKAKLALSNATSTSLSEDESPTNYGLKIKTVYISPDAEGAKTAPAATVWVNPDCSPTTSKTEIDGKTYEYLSNSDCNINDVKTYFNLARSTAAVNADLNSQNLAILPGTYNYVHIEICSGDLTASTKNIKYQTSEMTEPKEVLINGCTISSNKAKSPIQITEGGGVTVTLTYDLTGVEGGWPTNLKPSFKAQ